MSWKLTIAVAVALLALSIIARAVDVEGGTATWDISRASAFTTYILLWAALVTGTGVNTRFHPGVGRQLVVLELHRMCATLGLAFVATHMLTIVLDPFIGFAAWDAVIPLTAGYRPVQVGLGVIAMWGMVAVVATTWGAGRISHRLWRRLHWLAYPAYLLALIHALTAGSDTEHWPTHVVYSATAGTLLGALFVRFVALAWVRGAWEGIGREEPTA
jgi:methionine sulfoxide reductase heme-binding subunit